mmetsp:Transcript_26381/g.36825  ORF Transcript_26381/g.36825 Transcript_26381/m.36825 type:complete len:186 (-) Transcript_26381:474-1031(-)
MVNGDTITLESEFLGEEGCTAKSKLVLWNLYTQQIQEVVCDDLSFTPPGEGDPVLTENPCDRPYCYPEPGPQALTFTGDCIATDLVTIDFSCPCTIPFSSDAGVTPQSYDDEDGGAKSLLLPHGETMHTAPHPFRSNETLTYYSYTHISRLSRHKGIVHTLGSEVQCTSVNPFACLSAGGGGIFG